MRDEAAGGGNMYHAECIEGGMRDNQEIERTKIRSGLIKHWNGGQETRVDNQEDTWKKVIRRYY